MGTKIKYKGKTTVISDNLFQNTKVFKDKPRKSYKFDVMSLYYDGVYYFPEDIEENNNDKFEQPYKIQVVYYQGKWYQDTHYITEEFKDFIVKHK